MCNQEDHIKAKAEKCKAKGDKCTAKNIPKSLMQTSCDIPFLDILSSNIEGSTLLVWSNCRRCIIETR